MFERAQDGGPSIPRELMSRHLADLKSFVSLARGHACVVAIAPHGWLQRGSPWIRRRYLEFVEGAEAEGLPVWSTLEPFDNQDYPSLIVNDLDIATTGLDSLCHGDRDFVRSGQ